MGLWKEHFHWSVLLRWDVLGWIIAAFLAVGGLVLIFDQYAAANTCFMLTTVFILAKISQLAAESHSSTLERFLFTFVLFGIFGIGIVETIRGVNHWAESKRGTKSEPSRENQATVPPQPQTVQPHVADAPFVPPGQPKTPKTHSPVTTPKPPPQPRTETRAAAVPPLRRPIEAQAAMLQGWIVQTTARTKANEMWLSQIFQSQLDNIPDGPDVDVPRALRYLASEGEVEILQTTPRPYRAWWGELFEEDIHFRVKKPKPPAT